MQLTPNTYTGLAFGLTYFDGIETDIRLTKDNDIVIFHDSYLETGEKVEDLSLSELTSRGIPSLRGFFSIQEIQELVKTKDVYIELKPNCAGRSRVVDSIIDQFYDSFMRVVEETGITKDNIKLISFVKDLLDPFTNEFDCYPLLPDVNECSDRFVILKALPQVLRRSLETELHRARERGFSGIFFAREYVMGWTSWRHPSYENIIQLAEELGMLLGTNLGTPDLEFDFPEFVRFSDKLATYPRYSKHGENPIIAHRGTGTKGVTVPDEDIPDITL